MLAHVKTRLKPESKEMLDAPLTVEELLAAAKIMKRGKAPGLDGLPIELFKALPEATVGVMEMWEQALSKGYLSYTASVGKLCIMYKKDDRLDLKNYRPLTLMNSDYKIIAKALATRLASVIKEVVGPEQTGFIAGRNIKYNVMEALLVTKHRARNSKAAIVLLDFEKAYDICYQHRTTQKPILQRRDAQGN
jgi:hypothetical protein